MAKPYDRNFKVTGQSDARGQLYIFAGVPLGESVDVSPVDKDLAVPGFLVDDCYLLKDASGTRVMHLEAELRWHPGIPRDMARYIQALDLKLELPVESVVILLTPHGLPDPVPSTHEIQRGAGFKALARFTVRKLWEIEAGAVLELGKPSLLPWVVLMKATPSEIRQSARLVSVDRRLAVQFLTLGKLNPRYNEVELLGLLGRRAMLLKDSILEQSPYLQSFMNKARIQGQEQGIEKGIEKGRKTLLAVLHELVDLRFKSVPVPAVINRMDLDQLKHLVVLLSTAPDTAAARKILRSLKP